jgi:hypothetical protein
VCSGTDQVDGDQVVLRDELAEGHVQLRERGPEALSPERKHLVPDQLGAATRRTPAEDVGQEALDDLPRPGSAHRRLLIRCGRR